MDEAIERGLVAAVPSVPDRGAELEELRAKLKSLAAERASLEAELSSGAGKDAAARLDQVAGEERATKVRFLEVTRLLALRETAVDVEGRHVVVTYGGRELRDELEPRIEGLRDVDLEVYRREEALLDEVFSELAARARQTFKSVARIHKRSVEPIYLKSLALGLATRPEDPKELAAVVNSVLGALPGHQLAPRLRAQVSEAILLDLSALEADDVAVATNRFNSCLAVTAGLVKGESDLANCATILFSWNLAPQEANEAFSRARELATRVFPRGKVAVAPFLLFLLGTSWEGDLQGAADLLKPLYGECKALTKSKTEASFAAALLAVRGIDRHRASDALASFKEELSRLSGGGLAPTRPVVVVLGGNHARAVGRR
ncbi:MAG: hypothetical protein Kow0069_35150 [Promethearchaeota archaeon]